MCVAGGGRSVSDGISDGLQAVVWTMVSAGVTVGMVR